ncbi:MAG: hypothetical protein ABIJ97_16055, partial [Bacteroidota bacterium]
MTRLIVLQVLFVWVLTLNINAQWVHYDSTLVGDENNVDIIFANDSIFMYCNSLYLSPNDGNNWSQCTDGLSASRLFYFDNVFFTVANNTVYRSYNSCQTWQPTSLTSSINDFCEMGNCIIAATTFGKTYISSDHGDSW